MYLKHHILTIIPYLPELEVARKDRKWREKSGNDANWPKWRWNSRSGRNQRECCSSSHFFRCVVASLWEVVSVRPSVRQSVRRSVCPSVPRYFLVPCIRPCWFRQSISQLEDHIIVLMITYSIITRQHKGRKMEMWRARLSSIPLTWVSKKFFDDTRRSEERLCAYFRMRLRIFLRGYVCPSLGPSVGPSVIFYVLIITKFNIYQ